MKKLKRFLLLSFVLAALVACFALNASAAEIVDSGYCGGEGDGTNLTWKLDSEGTLTITGSGAMWNYNRYTYPWNRRTIQKVVLPEGLTTIGNCAFYRSYDLTSITIPDSVTTIGDDAFYHCTSLTSVNLPEGLTSIGNNAFYECTSLTSVNLPEGLTSIGIHAFFACDSLTSVNLPEGLTTIGNNAFCHCTSLTSVTLPEGLTTIGSGAFYFCTSLTAIMVADGNSAFCDVDGVLFSSDNTLICYPAGKPDASYEVPAGTTSISDLAFYECTSLTSVTLPEGLTTIGKSAFSDCASLTSVNFPEGLTSIGDYAFYNCTSLTSVTLSEGLTTIGYRAFYDCDSLTSVSFSEGLTTIGNYAFSDCASLTSVNFSEGLTTIGNYAFSYCDSLTSVSFSEGLTTIGSYAFYDCTNLTSVSLPDSLTSIGGDAFSYCTSLTSVYFEGNAPYVGQNIFYRCPVTLYYIPGMTGWTDSSAYDSAAGTWNGYKLAPWTGRSDPDAWYIEPVSTEDVVVNGRGTAYVWFRLSDYNNKPIAGKNVSFTFGNDRGGNCITDGNGLFCAMLPNVTSKLTGNIAFSVSDFEGKLTGDTYKTTVSVKPFSFSQSWNGSLGVDFGGSIGPSAGIGVGVVKVEAAAVKAAAKAGVNGQFAVKNEYENGIRTLELTYTYDNSVGVKFKTGIDGTLASQEIKAIGTSAGITTVNQTSAGLKVEGYDPKNMNHLKDVGLFALQTGLIGQNSVWAMRMLDWIDVGAHNQVGYTSKLILNAGAYAGEIEVNKDKSFTIGSLGADAVVGYTTGKDLTDQTEEQKVELAMNYGAGFLKDLVPGTSGYALGVEDSNAMEMSAKFDKDDTLQNLTYEIYDGGKKNVSWFSPETESVNKISFGNEEIKKMAAANDTMRSFVQREMPFLAPAQLVNSVLVAAQGDYRGTTAHSVNEKMGIDLSFPLSLELGIGVDIDLSGSYIEEFSYEDRSGIYAYGETLDTSKTDIPINEIEARKTTLKQLLKEPIDAISNVVKDWLSTAWGNVKEGVSNAYATVKDAASDFWAEIWQVGGDLSLYESYAILALADEDAPDTDAAVAVTIGEPYLINIYTDEARTELVSEDVLAQSPVTLTLSYTADMLYAAGASADSDLRIYRFDSERNMYVCLMDSVQDKTEMTVTVSATKQGEYILATDNAAPLVSDFETSDQTAAPEISALVSDLSGISQFRFWLDDGETLVDETTLDQYYDEATGIFTYSVEEALSGGEHTAYFTACDTLGNANQEPFAFTFTVDAEAPTISEVTVPTETVTDANGFPVTAVVFDDANLSGVSVSQTANGKTVSIPMVQDENGLWTAQVTQIAGLTSVDISVVATDFAGNQTRSEPQTVAVDVPAAPTGLVVTIGERTGKNVSVTVDNHGQNGTSGWLLCAAYDKNGKMLGLGSQYVGLTGKDSRQYTLTVNCDLNQIAEIKTFLVDGPSTVELKAFDHKNS